VQDYVPKDHPSRFIVALVGERLDLGKICTMLGSALLNVDQRATVRVRLPFLADRMRAASIVT
jgi:hypothetical protein